MDWSMLETGSFGVIMGGVIALIYKFIGQRPDATVMAALAQSNTLISKAMDGFDKLDARTEKSEERSAAAIEQLNGTVSKYAIVLDTMTEGIQTVFTGILDKIERGDSNMAIWQKEMVETLRAFQCSMQGEHTLTRATIGEMSPKIDDLMKAQAIRTEQSEGFKRVMDSIRDNQDKHNGDVLEAVKQVRESQARIEQVFGLLLESNRRNEKLMMQLMEKPQQDIAVLAGDIAKEQLEAQPTEPKQEEDKTDV